MKISDRTLGYLSLVTLIYIFAFVAMEMLEAHQKSTTTIQVDFDELGSLQPEDLVVVRGYTVGTVGKVEWLGDRARIQINFDEPITLREGTRIVNVNYAIMGQRRVEIFPSKEGNRYPDNHIYNGIFEPGIAEVLRYIEDVNQQLATVREMIHLVVDGDSTHPSVQATFENIMSTIDGTLESADKLVASMQPTINHLFKQVNTASKELIEVTNQADTAVKVATSAVNEKIQIAENALKTISEGAQKANQLMVDIETDTTFSKLFKTSETVDRVNEMIGKIKDLIVAIDSKNISVRDENGNPVTLLTWKGINIIGETAREKARKRAEKGESLPK